MGDRMFERHGSRHRATFLFATPNWWSGAARVLDMGGTFDAYNSHDEADVIALWMDWNAVGDALHDGIEEWERVYLPSWGSDDRRRASAGRERRPART